MLSLPVQGEPLLLAGSGVSGCACTRPFLAVVSGQSGGRFSVSSGSSSLGFPTFSSSVSTSVLSFSGQADTGCFCDQQDKPSPKVHDLGEGRVCGRPELSQLPLGSGDLAVSPGPPSPSCAAGSRGAADRGDSNLPGMVMGSVVASSLQDVGSAHLVASSLSSMPQLPRFNQAGRIQYGSFSSSPHQGQPVNESDSSSGFESRGH